MRRRWLALGVFAILLGITGYVYTTTPTAFIPDEDQGFAIVSMQLPEGGSLDYTHRVQREIEALLREQPEISDVFDAAGFSFTGSGSNKATMFIRLKPWGERPGKDHVLSAITARVNAHFFGDFKFKHPDLLAFMVQPPSIPGSRLPGRLRVRARGPREPRHPRARRRVGRAHRARRTRPTRRWPASTRRSAPTSRRSSPTSTATRRRSSASRCRRCSTRCKSISAPSTSTTST